MPIYRLRLALKDAELILDYQVRGTEEWVAAVGCVFSEPAQAHKEFGALRELRAPAYAVLEAFKRWQCAVPATLRAREAVLLMHPFDFIEM